MKNLVITFIYVALLICNFPVFAQENIKGNEEKEMLVVINGKIASEQDLRQIPENELVSMHYLTPRDARNIYGVAGANGALLVKTKKEDTSEPVILKDGKRISADSLDHTSFKKIDVIRGRQALNLYGPAGKDGVFIVHADEKESLNILIEVVNLKGKPIKEVTIKDETDKILAVTNHCGIAYLEEMPPGTKVNVSGKNYQAQNIKLENKKVKVILEKQ